MISSNHHYVVLLQVSHDLRQPPIKLGKSGGITSWIVSMSPEHVEFNKVYKNDASAVLFYSTDELINSVHIIIRMNV